MSAKKDCNANIGGILAMRDNDCFRKASANKEIRRNDWPRYGGLGYWIGPSMATCSDYLDSRIGQAQRLGDRLTAAGIPVKQPIGGHMIIVDATAFLPLVHKEKHAAQVLAVELYLEAGVRGVEMAEFSRLAIPKRVYTTGQLGAVAKALIIIYRSRSTMVEGFRILDETMYEAHTFHGDFGEIRRLRRRLRESACS
ncbi:hypothetical protein BHE90_012746 [Fusarium euwallaceae]|uniref:Aromatic amino acid beta-eliminating lyase/threonine aldolase domain-containing protein n=1 Tax=Fusarium euwallaceae TaxID=1147111 RepID=A0A430LAR0_9HYPO|nr:hypothetical protein BHE90_012746 [Fusarium euwallaceae]